MLEWLRASGHDRDTIVMVLADHGEGLGDHDELTHAVLTYQSTMRVPWIVAGPGMPGGLEVRPRVATIDVVPTVLGAARRPTPIERCSAAICGRCCDGRPFASDPFYQESLFGRLNCHWASLRGWVKDDWKLITGASPSSTTCAADPGERRNLAAAEPDRVRRMTDDLQRGLQRLAPRRRSRAAARRRAPSRKSGCAASATRRDRAAPGRSTIRRCPIRARTSQLYDRLQAAAAAQGPALARAFDDVQQITRLDPDNPFAFGTLASMAYRHGSLSIGARAFARALELDPDRPGVRQNYGKLLRELERYADSERELRLAVAQSRRRCAHAREPGRDAGRANEDAEAATTARRGAGQGAGRSGGARRQGPAARGAGTGEGGAAVTSRRRRRAPIPSRSSSWRARILPPAISRRRATRRARRCVATPAIPGRWPSLGHALVREGQRAAGVEYLERAVAIGPRRPVVWETLADGFDAAHDGVARGCSAAGRRSGARCQRADGSGRPSAKSRIGRKHRARLAPPTRARPRHRRAR